MRVLLSLFFVLHFGAVLAYVGPSGGESLERLPEPVRTPLQRVLPPAVRAVLPAARPYLDLTGVRQHWTLFAPDPSEWAASVEVVAYYGQADERATDGGAGQWRADTTRLRGPREVPYPHLFDHRSFRIVYNLGHDGWGTFYRPILARYLCRTLRDDGSGRRPEGISLTAIWEHTWVWWRDPAEEPELYRQPLGGYTCGSGDDALGGRSAGAGEGAFPGGDGRDGGAEGRP